MMKFFKCSPLTWIYLQTFRLGRVWGVSIHAPVKGRPGLQVLLGVRAVFQSTPP